MQRIFYINPPFTGLFVPLRLLGGGFCGHLFKSVIKQAGSGQEATNVYSRLVLAKYYTYTKNPVAMATGCHGNHGSTLASKF